MPFYRNREGMNQARYGVPTDMSTNDDTTSTIEAVEFYWRNGCGFCARLDRQLNKAGIPMNKHNIWDNPDHAAFVRSVADGNETVPTIRIGDVSMVNPSLKDVKAVLQEKAPHLV